ncbi:hypothetical protein GO755_10785 [Spirosoma sp. HMF4905]|uniref:Uncharacterized protein n=1 Tax=Spirosoma arboris TaxID=2682092 RepID=A0A7K1S9P0_9BACT|nr:hypothetical protein [Spirosoma arboris]MVM30519.1 hypothetical protein [Spirosoma arboris]
MEELFSPDKQYKVSFGSMEIRMSHWVDQPYLVRISDNKTLFGLEHLWSADDVRWLDESTVTMNLRLYPGLLGCAVTLNVALNQGEVSGQAGNFTGTLPEVVAWINGLENPSDLYRY